MDEHIHRRLQILEQLRRNQPAATVISDLLREYGGTVPHHSGAGIFGGCIACLVDTGYIDIIDSGGKRITDDFRAGGEGYGWYYNYSIADQFVGKEQELTARLSDKLEQVQSVFGLSLSRLLAEQKDDAMVINPLFGKPWRHLSTDVFVLMPFHESLAAIFDDHITKVCKSLKLTVKRADDIYGSTKIIGDVWELIANAKVIIADCTGKNPNVFYELGLAHTLGKNVIIITQSSKDIPFDISHIRYIKYEYTPRGMGEFETTLREFIKEEMSKTG